MTATDRPLVAGAGDGTAPPVAALTGAHRTYVLVMLFAIFALNSIDRNIVNVLQQSIKLEFGLADWQLGVLTGFAFSLFYTSMGIPVARLVDRGASRTWMLAGAIALWSVMTAVCGLAQNFVQMLVARAGVGLGAAGSVSPSMTLISDYFGPQERARAMGIFSLGIPLGALIGLSVGGWAAQEFGWRVALMVVGVPGLLVAILFKLTVKEPPRGLADGIQPGSLQTMTFGETARVIWRKKSFVHLIAGASLASFCMVSVLVWFPPFFMRSYGLNAAEVGLTWGVMAGVTGLLGSFVGGWLADRLARRDQRFCLWVPAGAMLLALPFYLAAANAPSAPVSFALLLIPAVLNNIWLAPQMALNQTLSPLPMRAMAGALTTLAANMIGFGLCPPIVGAISDLFTHRIGNETDGLRWALVTVAVVYPWAGFHFHRASKSLLRDLES